VRLAALNLEGISGVDLGGLRPESVISENLRFSLNSRVSYFSSRCHLSVRCHESRCRIHVTMEPGKLYTDLCEFWN